MVAILFFMSLVDVTQAGEGQLEISVNNGTVPNSVKNLQKGVYMVRFVPRELRSHLIEVKFNGELLPSKYCGRLAIV